jgi:hypothetical protein
MRVRTPRIGAGRITIADDASTHATPEIAAAWSAA